MYFSQNYVQVVNDQYFAINIAHWLQSHSYFILVIHIIFYNAEKESFS